MSEKAFQTIVAIVEESLNGRKLNPAEMIKFVSDALSLYHINAEREGVEIFSDEIFRRTVVELLQEELIPSDMENEVVQQQPQSSVCDNYNKLAYRKRRGSVSSASDPFAPLTEYPKPQELFDLLYEILMNTKLVSRTMNPQQMASFVSTMYLETAPEGERLIVQGEYGDKMYLIESGEFQVVQDGCPKAALRAKSLFGEISLLYSIPRTASVICTKEARVWVANANSYTAILMADQRRIREQVSEMLEKNSVYRRLPETEKDRVLKIANLTHFSEDDTVEISQPGVFLVFNAETRAEVDGKEEKYRQGEILKKGARCKEQTQLLFVPDCIFEALGIV